MAKSTRFALNKLTPPLELNMKHILITITAVLVVGCANQDIKLIQAVQDGNLEAVQKYLAAGMDVNTKDGYGATPLLYAAEYGRNDVAELLITNGADLNATYNDGLTALHAAVLNGSNEIVKLLIDQGADVNAKAKLKNFLTGKTHISTPLDSTIVSHNNIAHDLLRKHGAKTVKELKAEGK